MSHDNHPSYPSPNLSQLESRLRLQLSDAKDILDHLRHAPLNDTDFVVRLYLEMGNSSKVAKRLQAMQVKKSASAHYQPCDVLALLDKEDGDLPDALWREVSRLRQKNKGSSGPSFGGRHG